MYTYIWDKYITFFSGVTFWSDPREVYVKELEQCNQFSPLDIAAFVF